ncbi:MAG: hypothetical protein JWR74_254 [Polaromonas sp.]|jgi:thioredoxin 1|nr:hypothetical protein [Polaromonas sp.]
MRYENMSTMPICAVLPSSPAVVCLCAEWCGLCRDYETLFAQMAARYPAMRFAWLDIETHADLVGDLEVETFPTVLMADARGMHFFGALTPQPGTLLRLLDSFQNDSLQVAPLSPVARHLLGGLQAEPGHWIKV